MTSFPIPVRLTNRYAQFICSPRIQTELKKHFEYVVPGAEFSQRYRMGEWSGKRCLLQRGRVPTGLFLGQWQWLQECFSFQVCDLREAPLYRRIEWQTAREYQRRAVLAMIRASNTGGLILSATGTGKTHLVGEYFRRLQGAGCFLVDELTLLEQARRELQKVTGEMVGVVGRSEFLPARITVATIQTLHRHREDAAFRRWFSRIEVLILDEIHEALNRRNLDVVRTIKPKAVFGLTATLEIEKPEVILEAMALAGPVIFTYSLQEGVAEGHLAKGEVCRVLFPDPIRGRATTPEADYQWHIARNPARNNCIAAIARECVRCNRRVVILVERLSHLYCLARILNDVPHQVICGARSHEDRFAAKKDMDDGRLPLIIATRVFAKGIDIRSADTIIDATGTPSANRVVQRYGRGTRTAEGKEGLLFVDIADRGSRFARAADEREKALRRLCIPIRDVKWTGSLEAVFPAPGRV